MFEQELQQLKQQNLLRKLTMVDAYAGPHITIQGKELLLMCSNDYLGLANHAALYEAASCAARPLDLGRSST